MLLNYKLVNYTSPSIYHEYYNKYLNFFNIFHFMLSNCYSYTNMGLEMCTWNAENAKEKRKKIGKISSSRNKITAANKATQQNRFQCKNATIADGKVAK